MSGLDLARRGMAPGAREVGRVILCSGYNEQVANDGALKAEVREFMIKPAARRNLCRMPREVVDGKR